MQRLAGLLREMHSSSDQFGSLLPAASLNLCLDIQGMIVAGNMSSRFDRRGIYIYIYIAVKHLKTVFVQSPVGRSGAVAK